MGNYRIEKKEIIFKVNMKIFNQLCILKAAYMFLDNFYVYLDKDKDDIVVRLSPKKGDFYEDIGPNEIVGEFNNELLNQRIRCEVSNETKSIRELILARALYSSYIDDPEVLQESSGEYSIETIAKDWFDNNG